MEKISEKQLEQLIVEKLNKKDGDIQKTDGQWKAFAKKKMDSSTLPDYLTDPEALLQRGYVSYEYLLEKRSQEVMEGAERLAFAARNGQEISEESLQKIIRLIDEDDAEEKTQD